MNSTLFGATLVASGLSLGACTSDTGGTASGADEDSGISMTFTDAAGSEAGESGSESEVSAEAEATGDGDGDGDTGGFGDPCETDDDCGDTFECGDDMTCVVECGTVEVTLEATPPPVMLVLDKSGSMVNNSWDHDANAATPVETRWATLHRVVTFVLTNFEAGIDFGAQLFPSTGACPNGLLSCYNEGACVVNATPEVDVTGSSLAPIIAAIPVASADDSDVQGGTPAADGIRSAVTALKMTTPAEGINPAIIFITDGAANCGTGKVCPDDINNCDLLETYDDDLPVVVGDAFTMDNIATYVIGIDIQNADLGAALGDGTPAANPYVKLNEVAVAGGVPQAGADSFFNATNEAELQAALELIVGTVATCSIDLTVAPNMPPDSSQVSGDLVVFNIGGMDVPGPLTISEADCEAGTEDGWIWVTEGVEVLFCGTYCDEMKSTGQVDGDLADRKSVV